MTGLISNPRLVCCIFAGGEATRLYPHTLLAQNQKPMLVMGYPSQHLIDYSLRASSYADHTFVVTSHDSVRAQIIERYALNWPNVMTMRDIRVSGTGGSLIGHYPTFSEEDSDTDIVILASDHVHEGFVLADFYRHHLETGSEITLLTSLPKDYGEYVMVHNGFTKSVLSRFVPGSLSTTGTYIIKLHYLLEWMRLELVLGWDGEPLNLYRRLICPAIEKGKVSVFNLPQGAYWDDAGTLSRYYENNMRISGGQSVISEEAIVSPLVTLIRSVVIGDTMIDGCQTLTDVIISATDDQNYITQVNTL